MRQLVVVVTGAVVLQEDVATLLAALAMGAATIKAAADVHVVGGTFAAAGGFVAIAIDEDVGIARQVEVVPDRIGARAIVVGAAIHVAPDDELRCRWLHRLNSCFGPSASVGFVVVLVVILVGRVQDGVVADIDAHRA